MPTLNEPWIPPDPPSDNAQPPVNVVDPRVVQDHQVSVLPCPPNPPPPVGWAYWNHSVRAGLVALATKMLHDGPDYPMGSFVQEWVDGELVAARVEWHDFQGASGKQGCFRGVNLMQQVVAPMAMPA
jgi:hypothetical protein